MRHLLYIFTASCLLCASSIAQTMKALMYNTNGQVVYSATNILTFPEVMNAEQLAFSGDVSIQLANKELIAGGNSVLTWQSDLVELSQPMGFSSTNAAATTRANLGFSTNLNTLWTATNAESARNAIGAGTGSGGSVDLGSTNATGVLPIAKGGTGATNAATSRTNLGLGATNDVVFDEGTFSGPVTFNEDVYGSYFQATSGTNQIQIGGDGIGFFGASAATTRANLSLGATWLTNTNVTNFRTAIGLGATGSVSFEEVFVLNAIEVANGAPSGIKIDADGIQFGATNAATTRTNLGLGATNNVTFAGLTNNGDIRINQTTASNGLLYVYRTNNEPFLGLANLIASNNTTVSNETLFRVGVAEATNRAAQFGFRSTNTNGNGVAVFSVFGFNALMQIGADASTNAVIFSGGGTNNEVMTLIRDGATEFARPLRFSTNASTRPSTNAPANTTNVAAWVEMRIGTNSYRVPLYQ